MQSAHELTFELTPTQEAMLLYSIYAPHSPAYFERFCYAFRGSLDTTAFSESWQRVANRHSILRTSFFMDEEARPRQVVHEHVELPIIFEDWRDVGRAQQEKRLEDFLARDCSQGFDLAKAPLLRVALLQTGDKEFFIVISNHHLVLDGWSMGIVRREVSQIYRALTAGEEIDPAPAPLFSDYVQWLRNQRDDGAKEFWRNELGGFTAPNGLPIDRAPATLPGTNETFGERAVALSEELSIQLQRVARSHRLTMSTIVQGAWALLLSRYCRTEDVVFGITVSGRPFDFAEVDSLVGMLINTLPLRVAVKSETNLAACLHELQKHVSRLREHENGSLQQIHELAGLSNKMPLFETLVVFENFVGHDLSLDLGGEVELTQTHLARTNYPLTLVVNPDATLGLRIIYHESRFADDAIEALLEHLVEILASFATDLDQAVATVNLLTEVERRTLLEEWSTGGATPADIRTIHRVIEERAAKNPDAIAIENDSQQLTYAELNARANQLARYIRDDDEPNALIAICLERSIDMLVAVLAVLKAGAAYVPLDPTYPADRLALMLNDSGARLILTREAFAERFANSQARVVAVDAAAPAINAHSTANLPEEPSLDDLAYVIYTSGSTGTPKGVCVEHRALASFTAGANVEYAITAADRVLQFASLSFDTSVEEIFCALATGATLVLRSEAMITSPKQFLGSCARLGITVLDLPTGYWHHLVAEIAEELLAIPSSVRLVILGGEQAKADRVAQWQQHASDKIQVLNTYGPTEATVVTTVFDLSRHEAGAGIPIGRPIRGARVYVLDQALQPTPTGVPGELYIGGAGIARGYLHRAELTAEKFIPNPFGEGRLYATGDLVRYLPDGNLEFLGRADHQVKIRGFRIELEEIEQALVKYDAVAEAVVVAREDGDGDKRLHAYVVFTNTVDASAVDLRSFLKTTLPPHMIPATFTVLETFPLMPNGKIDRRALPEPNAQRPPDKIFVAPRTPIEEVVAGVWCQALRLPRVSVDENFFELGGHSLLAARVFSDLQKTFTVELNLVDIFKAPTVAELAEMIYERQAAQSQGDELLSMLAELEQLSDDEAHRQLADERTAAPAI
jgi:amino acid adenylation domain-containing protein